MLKRFAILISFLFISYLTVGQMYTDYFTKKRVTKHIKAPDNRSTEVGFLAGISYYNGEMNLASQFNPKLMSPSIGLILRRNLNSRWAFRLNGMWGKLKGNDNYGNTVLQQSRGLAFKGSFIDFNGQFEFNFIPYCACDNQSYITPFLFVGAGAGWYRTNMSYVGGTNGNIGGDAGSGSAIAANLPFGFGAKYKLSHRFLMSLEWGFRKTYTDYIDGVSTVYDSTNKQIGNSKNDDWYSIVGLSLTIRLGPQLTTCVFGQ